MAGSNNVVARKRWKILGEALINKKVSDPPSVSVRCFSGFGLFKRQKLEHREQDDDGEWFLYSSTTFQNFNILIRHVPNIHTPDVLTGFNNTGNVGVWPSEEILAHYCLENQHIFNFKNVCELGGGMTCLAGMALLKGIEQGNIVVSDGNDRSLQNLEMIVKRNSTHLPRERISARKIIWSSSYQQDYKDLRETFDYVLCADCLFFKESVKHLADLISFIMKPKGLAIIVAPGRSGTFQNFIDIAKVSFNVNHIENYSELVTQLHQKNLKNNTNYCEDLHYPQMMHLTKLFKIKIDKTIIPK